MLIRIILAAATVLTVFWLLMLMAVSREDWTAAAQNKLVDNLMKEDELRRKDAAKAKFLEQYHGIVRAILGIFVGGNSEKEIAKLQKQSRAIASGKLGSVNVLEMPGYTMQRVFPSLGAGALYQGILEKCIELYGKKYARNKAVQTLAQTVSYPVIGIAVSLALGCVVYLTHSPSYGLMAMGMGSLLVIVMSRSYYNRVGDDLKQRRVAISRQFPNVVSKLALLVTSDMNIDRAWRETAASQEMELYQEMRKTSDELDRNVSPEKAYTNFIDRCNTKETTKLGSAIIQSLSKGNAEIGVLLKSMAHDAWQERQHTARRDAENANSKLMIPTFMLFAAIMIIIMVPIGLQLGGMG